MWSSGDNTGFGPCDLQGTTDTGTKCQDLICHWRPPEETPRPSSSYADMDSSWGLLLQITASEVLEWKAPGLWGHSKSQKCRESEQLPFTMEDVYLPLTEILKVKNSVNVESYQMFWFIILNTHELEHSMNPSIPQLLSSSQLTSHRSSFLLLFSLNVHLTLGPLTVHCVFII